MASWHAGWLNPAGMELTGIAFLFTINLWSSPSQALISRFLVVQLKKLSAALLSPYYKLILEFYARKIV